MSNVERIWRAGAIGYTDHGNYGHGLHLPYRDLPSFEMVAIADPDEKGRETAMAETGAPRGYADYKEMLAKEALDVVSVCPRHTIYHRDLAVAAADAKCHIYCEKALARDLQEADDMIEACERNGVLMAVSHQARYVEPFLTAREMLRNGEIGELLSIHGRGKEDSRGGGEDMLTLGTHVMDMMRFLGGSPEWVFGHVTLEGRDITRDDAAEPTEAIGPVAGDEIYAVYGFPNGVTGTFTSIRGQSHRGKRMGVTLVGAEGLMCMRFSGETPQIRISKAPVPPEECTEWETIDVPVEPPAPNSIPSQRMDSLSRGNRLAVWDLTRAAIEGRAPVSSGKDARGALEMILGVYASHLEQRRLPFPLEDRRHPLDPR